MHAVTHHGSVSVAHDLLEFIDSSPSPYHAVEECVARLTRAGFVDAMSDNVDEPASTIPGHGFFRNGGMLIAWVRPADVGPETPFRIVGAHTDSPNLRIKAQPELTGAGFRRLAAEPYGGALLNSWLDRDLGLSGRVGIRTSDGTVTQRLFRDDRPILRVPQLAIHLDRDVNERGLVLDRQHHLNPVWGLGTTYDGEFKEWLADAVRVSPADVLSWDAMCHDTLPAGFLGVDEELISAARLDNLCSCFAAVTALIQCLGPSHGEHISVIALFDHEEVGSESASGASSPWLQHALDLLRSPGGTRSAIMQSVQASRFLSSDMAHGVHPNYPERSEPTHRAIVGGGPVIKHNVNQRYATDSTSAAEFTDVCSRVGVPTQQYFHRADMGCGSTIGPIVAARLGISTVDVGMAQLSMHSARELMGSEDVAHMCTAYGAWLSR